MHALSYRNRLYICSQTLDGFPYKNVVMVTYIQTLFRCDEKENTNDKFCEMAEDERKFIFPFPVLWHWNVTKIIKIHRGFKSIY